MHKENPEALYKSTVLQKMNMFLKFYHLHSQLEQFIECTSYGAAAISFLEFHHLQILDRNNSYNAQALELQPFLLLLNINHTPQRLGVVGGTVVT